MDKCRRCGRPQHVCMAERAGWVQTVVRQEAGLNPGPQFCWQCFSELTDDGRASVSNDFLTLEAAAAPYASPREVALSAAAHIMASMPNAGRPRSEVAEDCMFFARLFAQWLTDEVSSV